MDTKSITAVIIGLMVSGLILVAFVPIFTEVTATEDTFTNKGMFNAQTINVETEYTMVWEYTNPLTITVNDTDIDMSATDSTYSSVTVIFSDDWFVRYSLNTGLILYKCGTSSAQAIEGATVSSEKNLNLSLSGGSATIVIGENTYNYSVEDDGVAIVPTLGDWVIKKSTDTALVNGDSVVYGAGRTDKALGVSGTSFNAIIKASVDDGVQALYYSPQYNWSTNSTVNATENSAYIDLYGLTGFTFNLVDNNQVEHAVTYNQIFVPREVTSEKSVHGDEVFNTVIDLIPLLAGVGLLMAGVYYFISRK